MRRIAQYLAITLLIVLVLPLPAEAALGPPINFAEQRVNGHGFRFGADQFAPDISGDLMVWQDHRGTNVSHEGNSLWSKNPSTRDESPVVTTLSTDEAQPRVSGDRVAWTDIVSNNNDIFAKQLPGGSVVQVTTDPAFQIRPSIDGTLVVWEDYRNGPIDIFKKDLAGGSESAVVTAAGNQSAPDVSGSTVAWRDGRVAGRADVFVRTGSNPEVEVRQVSGTASSLSPHTVAISGSRLLWNEPDADCVGAECDESRVLKTCVLPCGPITTVDSIAGGEAGGISSLDLSGSRAVWQRTVDADPPNQVFVSHFYTADLSGVISPVQVDSASPTDAFSDARISGSRVVWGQTGDVQIGINVNDLLGLDILWKDVSTGNPPMRANSIGMGHFGVHLSPAADSNLVAYKAPGSPGFKVWATDLTPPRRHLEVSTHLGTDLTRPAVTGTRVAWSDARHFCETVCDPCDPFCWEDVFQRNPYDSGIEVELSEPGDSQSRTPDVDGTKTVWNCDSDICYHNGSTVTVIDVSGDLQLPTSTVGNIMRLSGDIVLWHEGVPFEFGATDARIHARNVINGDDEIIASGVETANEMPDFDIEGTTVIWAGPPWTMDPDPDRGILYRITLTGCGGGGSTCDNSASATVFESPDADHILIEPSIGGGRVAWRDCVEFPHNLCDVYTRTLIEADRHLVTNSVPNTHVESPFVDDAGDRIYWVDTRNGEKDIFMESATGAALPQPDTAPPAQPTDFTATLGSSVDLTWSNPPDADFYKVRILRKSGLVPPSGIDDTSASVIYEGSDESYTDTDTAPGVHYSYAIFAFDLEPNFSQSAAATFKAPAGAVALAPASDTNPAGTTHTVTATVANTVGGAAADGTVVTFTVTGLGATVGTSTTTAGSTTFSFSTNGTGVSTITASAQGSTQTVVSNAVTKNWHHAPPSLVVVTPPSDSNQVGQIHSVTATASDQYANPIANHGATMTVTGPGAQTQSATTNGAGVVVFSFTSVQVGSSQITITVWSDGSDASGAGSGSATGTATKTWTDKRFVPLTPARVVDTRSDSLAGTCSPTPCAAIPPGGEIEVQIQDAGGVPGENVDGVILNATVVNPASEGFLTIYPKGQTRPVVSNLNFVPGDIRANLASLKVGDEGRVVAYNGSSSNLHIVFDVAGYYTDGASPVVGGSFQALTPARLLDTRDGTGQPSPGAIPAGGTITLTVTGVGEVPASGVGAAVLNMTVTEPTTAGFLTVYPQGGSAPLASNVNFAPGQTIPNLSVVKLSTEGKVSIFNGSSGPVHVVSDVSGVYSTASANFDGGGHDALSPVRILDTRNNIGGFSTPIPANSEITVQVLNVGGVPATEVQAVVLNVTVDQPQAAGYLTVYPSGVSQPTASNLNFTPGRPVPNLVMVKHGGGQVKVFNGSGGTVHVIFDVNGWFAPVLIL